MFERYHYTLADEINGKQIGDGKAAFKKAFHECTENKMRANNQASKAHTVTRASGIVGVEPAEYEPMFDEASYIKMEDIRQQLQNTHMAGPDGWVWENINRDMKETYALQRKYIIEAKEQVEASEASFEENVDEPQPRALERLKKLWPFLFMLQGLTDHHDRLTHRCLKPHLDEFVEKKLDYMLMYLTSGSKTNQVNVALGMKLDRTVREWTPARKFLKMILMLMNHFSETKTVLFETVEVCRKCLLTLKK